MDFVYGILEKVMRGRLDLNLMTNYTGWLNVSARNHARNFRRTTIRRKSWQTQWPALFEEDEAVFDLPDQSIPPEVFLLHKELRERIFTTIVDIDLRQRNLFIYHYCFGHSVEYLAQKTGDTPNAIRKSLARTRKKLRRLLAEQGLTENSAREYLMTSLPCC